LEAIKKGKNETKPKGGAQTFSGEKGTFGDEGRWGTYFVRKKKGKRYVRRSWTREATRGSRGKKKLAVGGIHFARKKSRRKGTDTWGGE